MKALIWLYVLFISICSCTSVQEPEIVNNPKQSCAPVTSDRTWYESDNKAPLFEGLDVSQFPITAANSLTQTYFNQGLILSFGFNHAEAARSFYYATKLDSNCAMAYWGYAYVLGPNYNAGMEPDNYERAYAAINRAGELASLCTEIEKNLIQAMQARYTADAPEDRTALDKNYAIAMKKVFEKFPENALVGMLYAESLMNLHPWDLYDNSGMPKEWTPEILETLEKVFAIDSVHPGAHHLYIHAVEASSHPENGLASANLFDNGLVANAGHLVHMPSHIYIRTGDYHKGSLANINAVAVDSGYITQCHAQGAYPLAYYPHNYHFLAATATLEGNSFWARKAAQKMKEHSNIELMKQDGWGTIQHYYTIPYYVNIKFAKWDRILEMENDDKSIAYPEAVRHYARGMAHNAKGDRKAAEQELHELINYANDDDLNSVTIWEINSVYTLLQIAKRVLKAEILTSQEKYDEAILLLNEAVEIEDKLNYNEPPDWFFSVRHKLGDVQLRAGYYELAVITFKEDLERLPKNGWALNGLAEAYQAVGDAESQALTEKAFLDAWATADVELRGSVVKKPGS